CYPLPADTVPLETLDFLCDRGPTRPTPQLDPILQALRPRAGVPLGEVVASVRKYVHDHFEYAHDVTSASSPIADILTHRKGVCQDFAHLMIAILRTFDLPA